MKTASHVMPCFVTFVASRVQDGSDLWLRDFDDYKRHVVVRRAMAPRGYAVKNLVFHILQRQRGGLADNFAEAFDAQHIALLVEAFRGAVGVDDEAIAGLDGHDDGGFAT